MTKWHPVVPPMSTEEAEESHPSVPSESREVPLKHEIDFEELGASVEILLAFNADDNLLPVVRKIQDEYEPKCATLGVRLIAAKVLVAFNNILKRQLWSFWRSRGKHGIVGQPSITRDEQKVIMERVKQTSVADLLDCVSQLGSRISAIVEKTAKDRATRNLNVLADSDSDEEDGDNQEDPAERQEAEFQEDFISLCT